MTTADGSAAESPKARSSRQGHLRKGARLELQADGLAPSGDGRAEHDGLTVIVPGLLPGERAEVVVSAVGRQSGRAYARVEALKDPSSDRRPPPCQHQGACSGCPMMIATEEAQGRFKRQRLAELGLEVDELRRGADPLGYRWSAKRVVAGKPGAIRLGSYRRGSHDLADMDRCLVDHPDLVKAAADARRVASRLKIVPYDETSEQGDLRYLWLKTNGAGEVLMTFVTATERSRVPELAEALSGPAGVAWCVQPAKGNALRGEDVQMLRGASPLTVELLGRQVVVGPLGFLQPNPPVAALAYADLVRDTDGEELSGALAYDLYAGAGVTTALLQRRFDRVVPCEAFAESAQELGIEPENVEAFLARSLQADETPQLVVANPPRAGLGEVVCKQLVALASHRRDAGEEPMRLHIMSCDPRALADDLGRLEAAGFIRAGARAYDTLPQTSHVEVVVWLVAPG